MPLREGFKANRICSTRYLQQRRSQTNKVPCNVATDEVSRLLIGGKGNFDRPRRMRAICLKLFQIEVRLLETGARCSPIFVVTDAADQRSTVPESSTEDSEVCRR